MKIIQCPECNSELVNKDGQKNGKQRYQCKTCGKKFTQGEYKYVKPAKKEKASEEKYKSRKIAIPPDNLINYQHNNTEIIIPVRLDKETEEIIKNDISKNEINFKYYASISDKLSSEEQNEIAKRLANIEFDKIESLMNEKLFQSNHNEKLDALIIKILISTGKKGISALIKFINNTQEYKITRYNVCVIGKHMSQNLDASWTTVTQYIRDGINSNCAYTITRYLCYVARRNYNELKNSLSFEDVRELYFQRHSSTINSIFGLPKMIDSSFGDNLSEYKYSIKKILDKLAKKKLINYDYLEQYNDSFFTEDSYVKRCLEDNCLSESGRKAIGIEMNSLSQEYSNLEYRGLQKEYDAFLDRYSNFVYTTILKYGIQEFESFHSSVSECVLRCKISTTDTEQLAEKICEKYFNDPRDDYPIILDGVFCNLLCALNKKAIDTFIYMIDNKIITEQNHSFYHNLSFSFIYGLAEKIYGDITNIADEYRRRRIKCGEIWESLVGNILKEHSINIESHPIFDNNKIPDYIEIVNDNVTKIQECKLTLGYLELKKSITKYSPYCDVLEIYCFKNTIDDEIINDDEYITLMNTTPKGFKYIIKEYSDICSITSKYAEALDDFKEQVKKTTYLDLLKEKVCIMFNGSRREKILYLLDNTFKRSGLFGAGNV